MRTWRGRNFVPENRAGSLSARDTGLIKGQILDALRVQMNFAMFRARQALQQFGEGTLRAMGAVDKR
jgi:hypothetical protein